MQMDGQGTFLIHLAPAPVCLLIAFAMPPDFGRLELFPRVTSSPYLCISSAHCSHEVGTGPAGIPSFAGSIVLLPASLCTLHCLFVAFQGTARSIARSRSNMHARFTETATTHLHYWKTIGVSLQQASNKGPLSMLPVAIKRYCCFSVTEVVLMFRHGWLVGHLSYIFVIWGLRAGMQLRLNTCTPMTMPAQFRKPIFSKPTTISQLHPQESWQQRSLSHAPASQLLLHNYLPELAV